MSSLPWVAETEGEDQACCIWDAGTGWTALAPGSLVEGASPGLGGPWGQQGGSCVIPVEGLLVKGSALVEAPVEAAALPFPQSSPGQEGGPSMEEGRCPRVVAPVLGTAGSPGH